MERRGKKLLLIAAGMAVAAAARADDRGSGARKVVELTPGAHGAGAEETLAEELLRDDPLVLFTLTRAGDGEPMQIQLPRSVYNRLLVIAEQTQYSAILGLTGRAAETAMANAAPGSIGRLDRFISRDPRVAGILQTVALRMTRDGGSSLLADVVIPPTAPNGRLETIFAQNPLLATMVVELWSRTQNPALIRRMAVRPDHEFKEDHVRAMLQEIWSHARNVAVKGGTPLRQSAAWAILSVLPEEIRESIIDPTPDPAQRNGLFRAFSSGFRP